MSSRKIPFAVGEYYHVYNRGVDKREIFKDRYDVDRMYRSMIAFNTINPVGSLRNVSLTEKNSGEVAVHEEPLVDIIAYCFNPNHFHIVLKERVDGGISDFMKRLIGGYVWYFNNKYDRTGGLFEGPFQAAHIDSNEYLLHVSVYVNLNFRVHQYSGEVAENILSSWDEYAGVGRIKREVCAKESVLGQFKDRKAYIEFAEQSLVGIIERKRLSREMTLE